MSTSIKRCTCINAFQDERYGVGMRVHNFARGGGTNGGYRCTVCSNVVASAVEKEKEVDKEE